MKGTENCEAHCRVVGAGEPQSGDPIAGPEDVLAIVSDALAQQAVSSILGAGGGFGGFGGKIGDAPIEVVGADHQNKADIGATIARQWFDAEQVDTIMDLTTSSVALAVQTLAGERNKVTMVTGGGTTRNSRYTAISSARPSGSSA